MTVFISDSVFVWNTEDKRINSDMISESTFDININLVLA